MSDKLMYLFFVFIVDIPVYIISKTNFGIKLSKNIHKIISLINFIVLSGILFISFYITNQLFIIFVPFIIIFYCILGYSLNVELTNEDKAGLVIPSFSFKKMKIVFFEIITFPAFYLVNSWKK
ncbi:MAG: hypothetical protein LBB89_08125 [Treponema sp.]|jgi:hypothetical protein|nr:hypothetical protein [Treponema sp.]